MKRKHGDAGVTYSMEVSMDHPRPGCVLHWAINDWLLPPRVGPASIAFVAACSSLLHATPRFAAAVAAGSAPGRHDLRC